MNWEAIKQIYINVLKYKNSIEYLGDDRYKLTRYRFLPGQKEWEVEYKNGLRYGKSIRWYNNGQKQLENEYTDNIMQGRYRYWHKNGKIRWETQYKDGKPVNEEEKEDG